MNAGGKRLYNPGLLRRHGCMVVKVFVHVSYIDEKVRRKEPVMYTKVPFSAKGGI